MSNEIDPSDVIDGDAAKSGSACMALVPMAAPVHAPELTERLGRPNSSFVAQLIATAEHAPQTCGLRRASPAAAQAAYGSVTNQSRIRIPGTEMHQVA